MRICGKCSKRLPDRPALAQHLRQEHSMQTLQRIAPYCPTCDCFHES